MDHDWYDFKSNFDESAGIVTRRLIRLLSENSRRSVLDLSKQLNLSRRTTKNKLLKAEKDLNIKYTVEFSEAALGITSTHLIHVKFTKKPDYKEVEKILALSYIPQLAVVIDGKFDMLIYAAAITNDEYVRWDKRVQILLSKYGVLWKSSDLAFMHIGFFPLRNAIIDRVNIDPSHKVMLKLLNSNSRIAFSEISKTTGMHFNTVAYNFKKLLNSGYIKRFTLTMQKPEGTSIMSMATKYILADKFEEDSIQIRKAYRGNGTEIPLISRYLLCSQLVGSYDFYALGIFDNKDVAYREEVARFKDVFKRHVLELMYGQVERVILGSLPIRSIDNKKEYTPIVWNVNAAGVFNDPLAPEKHEGIGSKSREGKG